MSVINAAHIEQLLARFSQFIQHLKSAGYKIDVQTLLLAQQLYAGNDFSDKDHLALSLRTLICKNREQWLAFNKRYDEFWLPKKSPLLQKTAAAPASGTTPLIAGNNSASDGANKNTLESPDNNQRDTRQIGRASISQGHQNIDFSFLFDPQAMDKFALSCQQLVKALLRQWRKTHKSSSPDILDLRQSIQDNRKHGGTLLQLAWRKQAKILPQITLVIDVSRSMSNYSNALLQFAKALVRELPNSQIFIFNTRLVDISAALRQNRSDKVEAQLQLLTCGWGGGTRIAYSLSQLLRQQQSMKRANRFLIIHSDGLDTDQPTALRSELVRLKAYYRRLIWLSPLLRHRQYRIETAALKMALDKIDYLLPSYNSDCLHRLAQAILGHGTTSHTATGSYHESQ